MKKLLIALLMLMLLAGSVESQVKATFSLANPRLQGGYFMYDLTVSVPAGQAWKVGACNIRINFISTPTNALTVKTDNPVVNANPNISGANGYQNMTTTSIVNGTAISLNILTFNTSGFYKFNPGTYTLGTLRWTATGTVTNTAMTFRVPPAQYPTLVFDSTVQLTHPSQFTVVNPTPTNISLLEVPTEFRLYQNYPNPFNPVTVIKYDIPKSTKVEIDIYDITGRKVVDLVNQTVEAGRYEVMWNADGYSSGIYFYRIRTTDYNEVKRMILLK